jgi:hypothetical protein
MLFVNCNLIYSFSTVVTFSVRQIEATILDGFNITLLHQLSMKAADVDRLLITIILIIVDVHSCLSCLSVLEVCVLDALACMHGCYDSM